MRKVFRTIAFVALILVVHAVSPRAQGSGVYVVTYIEVVPNAIDAAVAVFDRYGAATRADAGNPRLDLLQEIARPERFAIVEVWKDGASLEAHEAAAASLQFRDALNAIQDAPIDRRVATGLFVGPVASRAAASAAAAGTVFVLTHVDVTPDHKAEASRLLEAVRNGSTQEQGNRRYDVLQQANRPNHFTVVEAWANEIALDVHVVAPQTRAFRQALMPMEGALYDERRYKSLR